MLRALIGILTACLIGMLAIGWRRAEERATTLSKQIAPFDWSGVSSRDLNIAAVFLTARDRGVTRAMDSLQSLSVADTTFRNDGHMIAHSLGRFAIAKSHGDPSVLAECRPTFQAGCYHGVLEGYLSSLPKVDAHATTGLCNSLIKPDSSRFPATECAHGLGHGFVEALGYNLAAALSACDVFGDDELKGECRDGVFMENMVHGLGGTSINVGDTAMAAHMHMMSHAAPTMAAFRASDLEFPCDSVATQYQPSCWAYQPVVVAKLTNGDLSKTLDECAHAPTASQGSCYQGFGKQSLQWFSWSSPRVLASCRRAGNHEGDCIAGGVEGFVDVSLNANGAFAFCSAASTEQKAGCFKFVGERMARVRATVAQAELDCASAGTGELVNACVAGTRRP